MSPRDRHLIYGSVTIGMVLLGLLAAVYVALYGGAQS